VIRLFAMIGGENMARGDKSNKSTRRKSNKSVTSSAISLQAKLSPF
jgi:hypothetical protein